MKSKCKTHSEHIVPFFIIKVIYKIIDVKVLMETFSVISVMGNFRLNTKKTTNVERNCQQYDTCLRPLQATVIFVLSNYWTTKRLNLLLLNMSFNMQTQGFQMSPSFPHISSCTPLF